MDKVFEAVKPILQSGRYHLVTFQASVRGNETWFRLIVNHVEYQARTEAEFLRILEKFNA